MIWQWLSAAFAGLAIFNFCMWQRERRRQAWLRAMLRGLRQDVAIYLEQLRLCRAELGMPKPFGEIKDRHFDGNELRDRPHRRPR